MATDIVLRNRDGDQVTYPGIETVTFDTPEGAAQATFTHGVEQTEKDPVELNFADGEDQTVTADDGYLWRKLTIKKPENLTSENILKDVEICGIVGAASGAGDIAGNAEDYSF